MANRCTSPYPQAGLIQLCIEELLGGQTESGPVDGSADAAASGLVQQTPQGRVSGQQRLEKEDECHD